MPPKKKAALKKYTGVSKAPRKTKKPAGRLLPVGELFKFASDEDLVDEDSFSEDDLDPYGISTGDIPAYMDRYAATVHSYRNDVISPENRYTMDEIKYQRQKSAITAYECVSATGKVLKPLVVFKNDIVDDQWITDNVPTRDDYIFFQAPVKMKGDQILKKWFEEVFLPQTAPEDPNELRLLIWDNISAHSPWPLMDLCQKHKVKLIAVPEEISHFTSPIEYVITPKIKKILSKEYKKTELAEGEGYAHRWLKMIPNARKEAMAPKELEWAWLDTGLWPVDVTKIYYLNHERVPKVINRWVIGRAGV